MYQGEYRLIGGELSFFSRKLEAQLRFQRVPWRWQFKTQESAPEIEARVGTHFIPVLATPDNWMIHDTISIGPMLSERFDDFEVVPKTPLQRATAFILEDFFNHWLGRSCVHTRWCYPDNVGWVGLRLAANMFLDRSIDDPLSSEEQAKFAGFGQSMYKAFGEKVCEYNGVQADQSDAVKADFNLMLDALGAHLKEHAFLLGSRPCIADFALVGAFKAHYITDPEPLSWLGDHRDHLINYAERFFGDEQIKVLDWMPDDEVPNTLTIVLDYLQRSYLNFAKANIAAGLSGEKYYEYDYGFGLTKARTQKRLNKARLHVQDELVRLGAAKNNSIKAMYGDRGILGYYLGE